MYLLVRSIFAGDLSSTRDRSTISKAVSQNWQQSEREALKMATHESHALILVDDKKSASDPIFVENSLLYACKFNALCFD